MKPSHVLVCADRSPDPAAIVRAATGFATAVGARVTLFFGKDLDVDAMLAGTPLPDWPEVLRYQGDAAEAVLEVAREKGADLVVIGNGAEPEDEEPELSPVVAGHLRHADVPIMVVPGAYGVGAAGLAPRRVLAPVDFEADSGPGLAAASALAEAAGAELIVMTVVPLAHGTGLLAVQEEAAAVPEVMGARMEQAERALDELRTMVGAKVAGVHVVGDDEPAVAIAGLATQLQADLIVLPSHGKGALARALLGSTTESLVAVATVPVVVFPPGSLS